MFKVNNGTSAHLDAEAGEGETWFCAGSRRNGRYGFQKEVKNRWAQS